MARLDIIQVTESISDRALFKLYPEIKQRYFWVGKLYSQSCFVEIIGDASEDVIHQYVQGQLNMIINSCGCFETQLLVTELLIRRLYWMLLLSRVNIAFAALVSVLFV